MKQIQPPDKHFLLAAQGWLELGNQSEAFMELRKISSQFSGHPDVVKTHWQLYDQIRGEEGVRVIAEIISELDLGDMVRHLDQTRNSRTAKRATAVDRFLPIGPLRLPLLFAVPYNLACYACQLGNLKEAWEWLQIAVELCDIQEIRSLALNDPDLEPLWEQIKEL